MIKVLGVGFNSAILLCLLLHCVLRKYVPQSTEVSLPAYLQKNRSALTLVVNLCIIDLASVILFYFIVPAILSTDI